MLIQFERRCYCFFFTFLTSKCSKKIRGAIANEKKKVILSVVWNCQVDCHKTHFACITQQNTQIYKFIDDKIRLTIQYSHTALDLLFFFLHIIDNKKKHFMYIMYRICCGSQHQLHELKWNFFGFFSFSLIVCVCCFGI